MASHCPHSHDHEKSHNNHSESSKEMPLVCSHDNGAKFTVEASSPGYSHISTFSPFVSPTILHDPVIRMISN